MKRHYAVDWRAEALPHAEGGAVLTASCSEKSGLLLDNTAALATGQQIATTFMLEGPGVEHCNQPHIMKSGAESDELRHIAPPTHLLKVQKGHRLPTDVR